ncbi:hypothetical protein [Miltoncostaea oceani]|uniref:hypothetical protein n=1 Tax=Miltoncostaea oceani TaxID=2843216 RepID=UPI001C3DDF85|nr:hypothetical protein [Miltoncostaea oceani]
MIAAGGLLAVLATQDSARGAQAIQQVQRSVGTGLRDAEMRIEARGGTLDVSWSAVPSPTGAGHLVIARLVVRPSGDVGEARFGVSEDQISPQNDLAERLTGALDGP